MSRSAWPSLAAADHATLLGFDVCDDRNLVVDLWLLWLYVICDFLLIFLRAKKESGWTNTYNTYICFEEIIFYFSNYEGFGECSDEACRVQYLQSG